MVGETEKRKRNKKVPLHFFFSFFRIQPHHNLLVFVQELIEAGFKEIEKIEVCHRFVRQPQQRSIPNEWMTHNCGSFLFLMSRPSSRMNH
jgi:hypothetical protein